MLWLPASRNTRSGRIFAEFYQATTFSILTPLAAAVRAESDSQQDAEPEDCEPYLDSDSDTFSDATFASTDTESAGPHPSSAPTSAPQEKEEGQAAPGRHRGDKP
ncbi:hypothetical protein C8F04DRAFT_1272087 [Mycena alexandri]|uniref:Uncharacterized protein n=1 Tax=Mycena alexandri TaxID=1745969 RepID=A0AAD6S9H4_9AGAR|nr:hypothetical protein C8F04DRAFT_1272087 [Mycena alexandri]